MISTPGGREECVPSQAGEGEPPPAAGEGALPPQVAAAAAYAVGPPMRRPLGVVVAIDVPSLRRENVIGFLQEPAGAAAAAAAAALTPGGQAPGTPGTPQRKATTAGGFWKLIPTDPRFPVACVDPGGLPKEVLEAAARTPAVSSTGAAAPAVPAAEKLSHSRCLCCAHSSSPPSRHHFAPSFAITRFELG